MSDPTKKRKGGPGLGQGRKPTPKAKRRRPMTFRFNPWVAAWLLEQKEADKDMTNLIEQALISHYGPPPPHK